MAQQEREMTVHEVRDDEEFALWLGELSQDYPSPEYGHLEEHHLVLADELGDWIGGLRYSLRGGVAQIVEIAVAPSERGHGHALRLLEGFEEAAAARGAHLIEFWTPTMELEPFLHAAGWRKVLTRPGYVNGGTWHLLERQLSAVPEVSS